MIGATTEYQLGVLGKIFRAEIEKMTVNASLASPENTGQWLTEFRQSNMDRMKGLASNAVLRFELAMENHEDVLDVQAHFITACTVLTTNYESLDDYARADSAKFERIRKMLRGLFDETAMAFLKLGSVSANLKSVEEYTVLMESVNARLHSLHHYFSGLSEQITQNLQTQPTPSAGHTL